MGSFAEKPVPRLVEVGGVYTSPSAGLYSAVWFHPPACESNHLSPTAHGLRQLAALAAVARAVAVARTPWLVRPKVFAKNVGRGLFPALRYT